MRHGLQRLVSLGHLCLQSWLVLGHLHVRHGQGRSRNRMIDKRRRCTSRWHHRLLRRVRWQRLKATTGSHGLLPHRTISRFTPKRSIHLSWVCQRLHVRKGSRLCRVWRSRSPPLLDVLHRRHVERRLLLALHGHGLEDVKIARFILHRALPVQELHLLVKQASLLLLLPLLDQEVIAIGHNRVL